MENEQISNGLSWLIDGIKQNDPSICGDARRWVLEMVLKNLETAKREVDNGADARATAEEFYLGACRFTSDQCSDESVVLMDALRRLLHQ